MGPIKAGNIEDSLDQCMENIRLERGMWGVHLNGAASWNGMGNQ